MADRRDRKVPLGIGPYLRLTGGAAVFGLALLAVFQAPLYLLWQVAILITEWGYVLALLALGPLWPGWRRTWQGRVGGALGLGAVVLALSPLARALPVARDLPGQLAAAFGPLPEAPAPRAPLDAAALLRGVPYVPVAPRSLIYQRVAGRELRLDFYPAQGRSAAPCVIVIHGGSWQSGDSTQLAPLNSYLAGKGYAVAAITYRLSPEWTFPAARDDVLAAVAFLKANAADLDIDATRLALLGRSAGGQLALLAGYTAGDPAIRGVVSFYGPTDMLYGYTNPRNPWVIDSREVLRTYLGGPPEQQTAAYEAASPLRFVAGAPPTLLIHGDRDELVSAAESRRLAEALAAAGRPNLLLRLPWATHGADFSFNGPSGQLSTYAVDYFLRAVLG